MNISGGFLLVISSDLADEVSADIEVFVSIDGKYLFAFAKGVFVALHAVKAIAFNDDVGVFFDFNVF